LNERRRRAMMLHLYVAKGCLLDLQQQEAIRALIDKHTPDELLNADLKEAITKQPPRRSKGALKRAMVGRLRKHRINKCKKTSLPLLD
jgi:hypothetical protein